MDGRKQYEKKEHEPTETWENKINKKTDKWKHEDGT